MKRGGEPKAINSPDWENCSSNWNASHGNPPGSESMQTERFIDPAEVNAVEAQGNYILLRRGPDSYLLRSSISELAEKLEPYGFIRIHRSVLVNTSYVQEIEPWPPERYLLRMRGGKEYTVTRTYKGNLRSIAEFWMGSNPTRHPANKLLKP